MKNASLSTIYTALTSVDFENKDAILAEIYAELHRGDAVKAAKAVVYETAKPIVFDALSLTSNPVTLAELWDAIAGNAPEDFTKSKLSYALTHQWADEVVKVEGKVNAYTLKA